MEESKIQMAEIYIAYFGRAPDADGIAYWINEIQTGVMDIDAITTNWANEQPEFKEVFGENVTHEEFVTKVYQNVLGREPDTEGLDYWTNEMSNGILNTNNMVTAVVNGAKATTGSSDDKAILGNRAEAGIALADAGINDIEFAKKIVKSVSSDVNTVGIVKSVVDIAKKTIEQAGDGVADLTSATETLDAVETMLSDNAGVDTLADTLSNLKVMMEKISQDVVSGTITDITTTLSEISKSLNIPLSEVEDDICCICDTHTTQEKQSVRCLLKSLQNILCSFRYTNNCIKYFLPENSRFVYA